MSITFACACGRSINAPDTAAGKRARCPGCGDLVQVPWASDPDVVAAIMSGTAEAPPRPLPPRVSAPGAPQSPPEPLPTAPTAEEKIWEYKVLTQKDKWFSGKFDPEKLEQALNAYAKQGWRMRGMASASVPGFGGNRDELIFVLER
jgi:hypothetical protein